jgi:U-box domain
MSQIISLLNNVKILDPPKKASSPVLEMASSSASLQGILESCYCPIAAQIMKDPVLPHCHECTQTCDRASLEQWFATGNSSCPLCGHGNLLSNRIRPNAALRNTIEALQASGILSGDGGDSSRQRTA